MGIIGKFEFIATWKAPFLNGSISTLLSPFLKIEIFNYCYYCVCNLNHRVPSGNIHSFVFSSFNVLLAEFSFLAACWGFDLEEHFTVEAFNEQTTCRRRQCHKERQWCRRTHSTWGTAWPRPPPSPTCPRWRTCRANQWRTGGSPPPHKLLVSWEDPFHPEPGIKQVIQPIG